MILESMHNVIILISVLSNIYSTLFVIHQYSSKKRIHDKEREKREI